ncbi:helix-turn-helix domain-containing protein [Leadbetterella sp. DM7]|uniref:helix-turn-helix domain-containing protein n=1 Tax=Leadbetterella sp. DM7 TaxID=3235085 RepID=UPI00349ED256
MKEKADPIRLIFGLKLKQFRQEKGWSLQELSERSHISASYLNEIEKGKKYPKTDKIADISRALGVEYDELVSSDLKKALGPTGEILKNKFFTDIPFEFFGIDPAHIIEIIADAPVKFSALVNTLIKIGRSYNVSVEKLYFAVLRSYLEIHKNYFPELEDLADQFLPGEEKTESTLKKYLRVEHQLATDIFDGEKHPALAGLRTVLVPKSRKFFLNRNLTEKQRIFALARESGFRYMGIRVRPLTSTWVSVHSFDEVFNNFKASYFAACILIPGNVLIREMQKVLSDHKFSKRKFLQVLDQFPVSEETVFYRLFSLLPAHFQVEKLYFLKFTSSDGSRAPRLIKEIHLVGQHDPQESRNQHYCRRWPGISILDEVLPNNEERIVKTQISNFESMGHRYFEIALAKSSKDGGQESITLGMEIDSNVRSRVAFTDDPGITRKEVGQTCEKCALFDCKDRVAAPAVLHQQRKMSEVNRAIEQLR